MIKWKSLSTFTLTALFVVLPTSFAAMPDDALSLQDCIHQALQNNKAIKIAVNNKDKADWTVREAQGAKGVTFSLIHKETRFNPLLANGVGDDKYTNNFANQVAISLPVYTGGKLEGQISQARHNADITALSLDAARQQLFLDTTTAYFSVLQYQDDLLVSQQTVADYIEHLNTTRDKYDAGLVAKSDVLQTQVKLANAQDGLIIARNNYINAAASLNNLIGRPQGQEVKLKEHLSYEPITVTLDEATHQALTRRPEIIQARTGIASAEDQITAAKSGRLPAVL
ncbi:MAG: TolC family protein, partial [Anaerohalosphaeraceae bacterium]